MLRKLLLLFCTVLSCKAVAQFQWINGPSGYSYSDHAVTLDSYDPGNYPGGIDFSATAIDKNGDLYIYGGLKGTPSYTLWKYDKSINQWKAFSKYHWGSHYGTVGIEDSLNSPGFSRNGVMWFDNNGYLWLHDNDENPPYVTDRIWRYNPATNYWTIWSGFPTTTSYPVYSPLGVPTAAAHPGKRYEAMHWADTLGNLWVYGGYNPFAWGDFSEDLWKFDIQLKQWSWEGGTQMGGPLYWDPPKYGAKGIFSSYSFPARRSSAFCWTDQQNKLWFFGDSSPGSYNSLWCYDPAIHQWAWFGGDTLNYPNQGSYNDYCVAASSNLPGPRFEFEQINQHYNQNKCGLWLFGGRSRVDADNWYYRDLWFYRFKDNKWILVQGDDLMPAPTALQSSGSMGGRVATTLWDDNNGTLYLFGGNYYSDIWTYKYDKDCICGIEPPAITIPNVFTPNNDGINDLFKTSVERYENFDLTIYNRWGEIVFKTLDPDGSWDGKKNGLDCSEGTYYYIIDVYDAQKKKTENFKGFISLIR